ncbi:MULTISPECIES: hypothetical protein [unclassified Novosphingobium]|uniref:hypothetical protein n=1 Tax=unclassified Novosphingobium TaxID=2644732 RepID=UPI00135B66E9|nr:MULTISPECIES: hypothetical protein [unclassified Novosphingobium]
MIYAPIPMPTKGRFLTLFDVAIARAIYPVLLELARTAAEPIFFVDLIDRTRQIVADPDHPIHSQIPHGMGRRLEALRMFTDAQDHPDLSCLVTSATGTSPLVDFEDRIALLRSHDWTGVEDELGQQCAIWEKHLRRRPKRTRHAAKELMWEHFNANRARYHADIELKFREEILTELEIGADVEDVFANIDRTLREPVPT